MQFPPADSTRLRNLLLDQVSLSNRQETRVFVHSCGGLGLLCWIRHLPTVLMQDPATMITGEPCAVGGPCEEECNWVVRHDRPRAIGGRWENSVRRRHSEEICSTTSWQEVVGSLAYAAGCDGNLVPSTITQS